jgi:hypothetical protein
MNEFKKSLETVPVRDIKMKGNRSTSYVELQQKPLCEKSLSNGQSQDNDLADIPHQFLLFAFGLIL